MIAPWDAHFVPITGGRKPRQKILHEILLDLLTLMIMLQKMLQKLSMIHEILLELQKYYKRKTTERRTTKEKTKLVQDDCSLWCSFCADQKLLQENQSME